MDSSVISISDDKDITSESSLTSTSHSQLWDSLSNQDLDIDLMSQVERPACSPPVYGSSAPTRRSGRSFKFYVVFVGDQPGCYRDWADACGRVTNYPGNVYKGYNSYEQALAGWRQHCHGFHKHPPGFIDGTLFVAPQAPEIPKTPPPTTPPPAQINTISIAPQSPMRTSSQIGTSAFPPIVPPAPTSPSPSRISASPRAAEASTPQRRSRIWAVHSPRFNSVVPTSAQAEKVLARAVQQGEEVEICEVDSVAQAEEWFRTLSLDE
ncbi:hypothetical protein F5878DRAFT_666642 [Lentinula raphanica]|uniref:Ribonuclease H1 N-terminal domain-containing protein n=1 Tax=Lentinula raphanica TaxID=153919 RepID=A0AA38U525_9AGAR|nr:hypothetical protein F5878DRAFT_666642 [Lentinula raphanica]